MGSVPFQSNIPVLNGAGFLTLGRILSREVCIGHVLFLAIYDKMYPIFSSITTGFITSLVALHETLTLPKVVPKTHIHPP